MTYQPYLKFVAPAFVVAILAFGSLPAVAAVDMFIKIEGVQGESKAAAHEGQIEVLSWSWGETNAGSHTRPSQQRVMVAPKQGEGATGATRRRGDTTLGDVVVVRELDKSSTKLQEASVGGTNNNSAMKLKNNRAPRDGSGRGDLTITKQVDASSPKLQEACASGKVFPKVEISNPQSYGGSRATYLKYELKNVMVTSCSTGSADGGTVPTEMISLNYEKISYHYDKKGGNKGNAETTWKVEKGEK